MGNHSSSNLDLSDFVKAFNGAHMCMASNGTTKVRITSWWREKRDDFERHITYLNVGQAAMQPNGLGCELELRFVQGNYSGFPSGFYSDKTPESVEAQIVFNGGQILGPEGVHHLAMDSDGSLFWSDRTCMSVSDMDDHFVKKTVWRFTPIEGKDIFTIQNVLHEHFLDGSEWKIFKWKTLDQHQPDEGSFFLELIY